MTVLRNIPLSDDFIAGIVFRPDDEKDAMGDVHWHKPKWNDLER